jgi:membrane protein YqaA with SNARE-associated domain
MEGSTAMSRFVAWLESFAIAIGGPGLFFVAFIDSSFVSLPQVNDLLVVLMVAQAPSLMLYYAGAATAGSLAGCIVLYELMRKGGDAVLQRKVDAVRIARARKLFEKYGVLAIVVPALLPPPAPFKVFVLLAGVARMPRLRFAMAVLGARGLRYVAVGYLAVRFGPGAMDYLEENGRTAAIVVGLLVLAAGVLYFVVRWLRRSRP